MKKTTLVTMLLAGALFGGLWLFAGAEPAVAECCQGECATFVGCYGGCQACADGPCSTICLGTCTYTCRTLGPEHECERSEVSGTCASGPPPEGPIGDGSHEPASTNPQGWVLLEVRSTGWHELKRSDVSMIAASSAEIEEFAIGSYIERYNESIRHTKAADPERWRRQAAKATRSSTKALYALRAEGQKRTPEVSVAREVFPKAIATPTGFAIKGRTDGHGRVTETEMLHSPYPSHNRAALDFVEDHVTLWAKDGGYEPLVFFMHLNVNAGRQISWAAWAADAG